MAQAPNTASPAAGAAAGAPPAKGGGSLLTLIVLVVTLGNLGLSVFMFTKVNHLPKLLEGGGGGGGGGTSHHEEAVPGAPAPTVTLDPFIVNLNEVGSNRYLKVTFEAELSSPSFVEELNGNKRAVRDEVLRYLSSLTVADTMGEIAKAKIQAEVMARMDKALGGGRIKRIYFTDFVVQ